MTIPDPSVEQAKPVVAGVAAKDAIKGLSCPRCGGIVPIPEGQAVVGCPYCDQRSTISGERGIRRYQAPLRVSREQAVKSLHSFLAGKIQIARDCASKAQMTEVFLVHLPFWAVWARGVAYAFGQVEVGSGDNKRYEPREKKAVRELTWNLPACEVGEFGVRQVTLEGCQLEPFNADGLHRSGMVFEPVGSAQTALESARASFEESIKSEVKMDRTAQVFTRLVRPRLGLVYYPLWVVRYLYHGRAFQIVVDGYSGQVLYGKAPGSVGYRAGVLVGGMAAGALVGIDFATMVMLFSSDSEDSPFVFALILFAAGMGLMWWGYRTFRHAEQYEYHRFGKVKVGKAGGEGSPLAPLNLPGSLRSVGDVISTVEKFR